MLTLVKLDKNYREQLNEMMEEWTATGETIIPYSIRKNDYREFETYLDGFVQAELHPEENHVPGTTYFCLDTERDIFVGAVNIRHYLNEALLQNGGHIGDGIRPSERRKGYATKMISLALEKCKELEIHDVLMVCLKENIGSAKSIMKNGGVLENEIIVDEKIEQRYWIHLE